MQCTSPCWLPDQNRYVPCGNCRACRIARSSEWTLRMLNELTYWKQAVFATLTYSENPGTLIKSDLQKFIKRLRKDLDDPIKYYAVGEYGEKYGRPHYHAIMFGVPFDQELFEKNWKLGYVKLGTVTQDSIRYTADYVQKKLNGKLAKEVYGERLPPFSVMSKGLGLKFAVEHSDRLREDLYIQYKGVKRGLPRYYIEKLGIEPNIRAGKAGELVDKTIKRLEKIGVKPERESYFWELEKRSEQRDRNIKKRSEVKHQRSNL